MVAQGSVFQEMLWRSAKMKKCDTFFGLRFHLVLLRDNNDEIAD